MSHLLKRLFYSAIFISLTAATVFKAPFWFFFFVVQGFIFISVCEFLDLLARKNIFPERFLIFFFSFLISFAFCFSLEVFVLWVACLVFFIADLRKSVYRDCLTRISASILTLIYLPFFFSYLLKLRELDQGSWWIFSTLLIVKGGDAGAFFIGKSFGKTRLIEHISPNKSVEGACAQFITSIILAMLCVPFFPGIDWKLMAGLGAIIGVVAQLGDLAESAIKRSAGVKDSGQIPALGGVLDILDSIIFCMPLVYYYILFLVPTY